jgi:hypothetical protein
MKREAENAATKSEPLACPGHGVRRLEVTESAFGRRPVHASLPNGSSRYSVDMPIRGKWRNPALVRCMYKKTYSSGWEATISARRASKRAGKLIISYVCPDCGGWHIGRADKDQIIVRQRPAPLKDSDAPKTATSSALPLICPRCSSAIPEERRSAAEQTGTPTVYCSRKCQQKACKKARHLRRNERMGRTPEFFNRMRED